MKEVTYKMKKFLCTILASLIFFSLTACGTEPEEKSMILTLEEDGITVDYQLDALDDTVQKITQTSMIDCSAFAEEQISTVIDAVEEYTAAYEEIEGVTCSIETVDTDLVETITIDLTKIDSLEELSDSGLLSIEGDADSISFEQTVESLKELGMTEKE